jgi:hypothetical protein
MPFNEIFVALAILDLLAVAVLAAIAVRLAHSGRATISRLDPAAQHIRRTAGAARLLAARARSVGLDASREVRALIDLLRHRVDTTRHLIRELKPGGDAVDTRAIARSAQATVVRGREWAGRLRRLRRAGASASSKNRVADQKGASKGNTNTLLS